MLSSWLEIRPQENVGKRAAVVKPFYITIEEYHVDLKNLHYISLWNSKSIPSESQIETFFVTKFEMWDLNWMCWVGHGLLFFFIEFCILEVIFMLYIGDLTNLWGIQLTKVTAICDGNSRTTSIICGKFIEQRSICTFKHFCNKIYILEKQTLE